MTRKQDKCEVFTFSGGNFSGPYFMHNFLLVLGGGSQPPGLFFRKALLNGRHRLSLMGDEYVTFPSLRGLTNICLLCM